jgi:hypothetical protein
MYKEGMMSFGYSATNMVWSTARVYDGITAGPHIFAAECWPDSSANYGAYYGPALASMTVIEIR